MPIPPLPWEETAEHPIRAPRPEKVAWLVESDFAVPQHNIESSRGRMTRKVRCPRFCCPTSHRTRIELHGRVGPGLAKKVRSQILNQAIPALCSDIERARQLKQAAVVFTQSLGPKGEKPHELYCEFTMSIYQKANSKVFFLNDGSPSSRQVDQA